MPTQYPIDTLAIDGSVTGLTTGHGFDPVHFTPPLVNPTAFGLYAAVGNWQPDPDNRFLHGVDIRASASGNYGGEFSSGIWGSPHCGIVVTVDTDGATGGNFDLTVDGAAVSDNGYNITANNLKTALEGAVGTGNVTVVLASGVYTLTFPTWHVVTGDITDLTGDGGDAYVSAETKRGGRPDDLDPFAPYTIWAYDECDLTAPSRAEVEARAAQILRLEEQTDVEREFAIRLLLDANDLPGSIQTASTLSAAVGYLEAQMALTNTMGYFHVGAQWAADTYGLFIKSGTRWVSPLGHTWVIGGGYVDGLDDYIVATSQPFGWRNQPLVQGAIDQYHNTYAAVAERSVLVGYEHLITAVQIT